MRETQTATKKTNYTETNTMTAWITLFMTLATHRFNFVLALHIIVLKLGRLKSNNIPVTLLCFLYPKNDFIHL